MIDGTVQVQSIKLCLLHAHPMNANVMSKEVMRKLRGHIERTRRYEPLVVRRHPTIAGAYELINGHHRKEVLESLGYTEAQCLVWELTDAEALMLLATINRLGGEDAPGKRLALLDSLSGAMEASAAELAKYVPEAAATLEKLLAKAPAVRIAKAPDLGEMPEAFTVFLKAAEKRELVAALRKTDRDLAVAIMRWARSQTSSARRHEDTKDHDERHRGSDRAP
jgi:ParB family transcriptional regulator, chromosome partitioning protein